MKKDTLLNAFGPRRTVLVDIDHTVSNAFHRDHMIDAATWDEYHAASINDEPVTDIVDMLRSLSRGYELVGITARPEKWRGLTFAWLIKHKVPLDIVLMRPDDNYDMAPSLKVFLASVISRRLKDDIAFVMDDRPDVCEAFAREGITCLQVYARRDK